MTFFSFFLLALVPGDPVTAIVGGAIPDPAPADRRSATTCISTSRSSSSTGIVARRTSCTVISGQVYFGPTGRGKVSTIIGQSLPVTLQLMLYAMILTLLIAIPIGVFSAYRAGTLFDRIANITAFGAISLPDFALGLILVVLGRRAAEVVAGAGLRPSD